MSEKLESIRSQYDLAGIGRKMGYGKRPAVLVVDFQKGFTEVGYPLAGSLDSEVAATRELLDVARSKGHPVVFTVFAYDGTGRDGGRYAEKIVSLKELVRGTRLVEIDDRLGRLSDEIVVEKKYQSGFFGTGLLSLLNSWQRDTAIICGCVTSSCVRATAIDAMQHGFYTIVPQQCVGDRVLDRHESNLFDLATKSADVVDKEEVLEYLRTV